MLKLLKRGFLTFSFYAVLSFYLYFTYHWIIVPLALDGGLWGILAIIVITGALILIAPKDKVLPYAIFTFLFLFLDKALQETHLFDGAGQLFSIALLGGIVFLLGRLVIRLPYAALSALFLVALLFFMLWPRTEVRLWREFRVAEVTSPIYVGNRSDYFPLYIDRDEKTGLDRIIVYGNREEVLGEGIRPDKRTNDKTERFLAEGSQADQEPNKKTYLLGPEIVRPYALVWQQGGLKRERISPEEERIWENRLMNDYPGFPYLEIAHGTYRPLIERDTLAERSLNFGHSPYLAFTLDALHLSGDLAARDGYLDEKASLLDGAFTSLRLAPGLLTGNYHQRPFQLGTEATQIIGAMQVKGEDVLVLLGKTLDIVHIKRDGQPLITHRLSTNELPDLFTADYLIAPLPGEGDVLFVSFPTESNETAKILKPLPGGNWRVLFHAKDPLFRFEDVRTKDGKTTILALPTSRLSDYPQRYLAEYTYENGQLMYRWKAFYSLINVRYAKLWPENHGPLSWMAGDDEAIVGMRYGDHRLYVLVPHHIPVYPLLLSSNALVLLFIFISSWRQRLSKSLHQQKAGGVV
ncbi:MAG: YIP1 family protein [Candidatus Carbobacillus altaicus]|nr:YIP1 family protein [Candidatus Carbobacillus altaicus]